METGKLFIGPRLRALRLERGLTQTDFARLLGVSGSLVNLLERNQRSASLAVLMRLSDVFGLEMQELTSANTQVSLQQLRKTLSDPAVGVDDISIDELRSAMDLAPKVVEGLAGVGKPNYSVTGLFTKAWFKSPIMSSTSSIPTARRTKPSSIPAF